MRIMYFLDNGQYFGGAANTLLRQAVLMKHLGYETIFVISYYRAERMNDDYYNICKETGIDIMYLPFQISSHIEDIDLVCMLDYYPIVLEAVKAYQPDILHSMQINPIVELVSRELKIPHIMNIYQALAEFFLLEYTDIFPKNHVCDSELYAQMWAENIQCVSTCIRTVVNSNNPLRNQEYKNRELSYFCVGGVSERKNQLEVIKAFEEAISKGIRGKLYLFGQDAGVYAEVCKQYIVKHDLTDKIVLVGFCKNIEAEYAKADVLICGSTCESYPNVISEALAHGLIVISTPVAGVPEIIKDGVNGYLSRDFSGISLCEAIMRFHRDIESQKVKMIQKNSYETYLRYHSPESVTDVLEKYYKSVLAEYSVSREWIRYEDLKKKFDGFLKKFYVNRNEWVRVDNVRKKLWHIYHMQPVIERLTFIEKKKAYIWGTGKFSLMAKQIIEVFFNNIPVEGYIDTYKKGEHCGLSIYSPEEILEKDDIFIFVGAMIGKEEIISELEGAGFTCNKDYFLLVPRRW